MSLGTFGEGLTVEQMLNADIDRLQAEKAHLVEACKMAIEMWQWDKSKGGRVVLKSLRAAVGREESTL